jgi:flagellar hook-basal body complex protein FliE
MVESIGSNGLQREALLAALRKQAALTSDVRSAAADVAGKAGSPGSIGGASAGPDFAGALKDGLKAVNAEIQSAERLPEDVALGKVGDFHEVAARIKRADLSFKFAMEIRNKLIDAYREVMRMPV